MSLIGEGLNQRFRADGKGPIVKSKLRHKALVEEDNPNKLTPEDSKTWITVLPTDVKVTSNNPC